MLNNRQACVAPHGVTFEELRNAKHRIAHLELADLYFLSKFLESQLSFPSTKCRF